MGRPRSQPDSAEQHVAAAGLVAPDDDADFEAYQALESLADEVGGASAQYTVHVFKRRADRNRISRCKRIPLDQFDVDQLPAMFGPGEFTLRVCDDNGRFVKKLRVDFDPTMFPPAPGQSGSGTPPTPPALAGPPAPAGSDPVLARVSALETQLRETQERHTRFLEAIVQNMRAGAAGGGLQETIASVKAILEIANIGGQNRAPAREIAESMRTAFEMAREFSGGGGGGDGDDFMDKVLKHVGPLILSGLEAGRVPSAPPALAAGRTAAPLPAPTPAQVSAAAPPAAGPGAGAALPDEWRPYAFVAKWTDQAKGLIRAGVAPGTVADLIYEAIPEQHLEALLRFAGLPDDERSRLLLALDPGLEPYMLYLHAVAAALREQDEGQDGNGGNTVRAE